MLTAHRTLGNIPGTYGRGWEIIDDDGQVVARVASKAEAQRIVRDQAISTVSGSEIQKGAARD